MRLTVLKYFEAHGEPFPPGRVITEADIESWPRAAHDPHPRTLWVAGMVRQGYVRDDEAQPA